MRTITTHESAYARNTSRAKSTCQALNLYKRANPDVTFVEMARWFNRLSGRNLSVTSIARYYYGYHGCNAPGRSYAQVRLGARVMI